MMRKLIEEYRDRDLTVNMNKRKYLIVGPLNGNLEVEHGICGARK